MSEPLIPDQLPQKNASFIAYSRTPVRVTYPADGDTVYTVRPQTFVRYYRGIKVKDVTIDGDTAKVALDPKSVGLEKAIGGNLNANDPVVEYLQKQHEAGHPVDVGMETVRLRRNRSNKSRISPVIPIHALRGALDATGDGDAGNMLKAGGETVRNIVSMVNGRRTTVCESDPAEWSLLTDNENGGIAPEGWKAFRDRSDWSALGTIIPDADHGAQSADQARPQPAPGSAPTGQGEPAVAGLSMDALAKMVSAVVREELRQYGDYLASQEAATRGTPTSKVPNGRSEPKPWVTWVNQDQINLGSYPVTTVGSEMRWAYYYMTDLLSEDGEVTVSEDELWDAAVNLAEKTGRIAEQVQRNTYGDRVRCGRADRSFAEATQWVHLAVRNCHPFSGDEDFDEDAWIDAVTATATARYTQASDSATANQTRDQRPTSATDRPRTASPSSPPDVSAADRQHVEQLCAKLTEAWVSADGLRAFLADLTDTDARQSVWAEPVRGVFAVDQFDGARSYKLGKLATVQLDQLGDANPSGGATDNDAAAEAPESSTTTAAQDHAAQKVAAALAKATTHEEVAALYTQARTQNVLTVEIWIAEGGHFGITPVPPGSKNGVLTPLGEVFTLIDAPGSDEQQPPTDEQPQTAQDIADAAAHPDRTAYQVTVLMQAAEQQGVAGETITIAGVSGELARYLKSRRNRLDNTTK